MRYSGTELDDDNEPWFRIGQLEVNTTTFVVVLWVVTLLVWIGEPVDKPITTWMALIPDDVAAGEVWRAVTWPWSHSGFGLFDLVGAAIFWLFGTQLEQQVGRKRFAWLLGSSIVIIAGAATLWSVLLTGSTVISDLDLLGLTVLLLYVAEHPTRPFLLNIPAWVVGAVIVALEVVNDLAYRDWLRLLTIALAAVLIALVARRADLLTQYDRVPHLRRREKGAAPASPSSADGRLRGRRKSSGPSSTTTSSAKKRQGPLWGKGSKQNEPAEIVQMPTPIRRVPPVSDSNVSADDLALDALLDKIADGGLAALSTAERQELDDLRARRRNK